MLQEFDDHPQRFGCLINLVRGKVQDVTRSSEDKLSLWTGRREFLQSSIAPAGLLSKLARPSPELAQPCRPEPSHIVGGVHCTCRGDGISPFKYRVGRQKPRLDLKARPGD